jgi:methionyl-tRNA formyltransferase
VKIKGMYVLDKNNTCLGNEIFKFDKLGLTVKTADKTIVITYLQFPNKNIISSTDAFNSYKEFFIK